MPATIDAAALCKMAERGQIKGGLLDGPLAFDNAISREAAKMKGITSEVAGDPDILLAPDLEAGNMMAKQLSFLANADSAGLVLGARVPIILTSRADSLRSRIASCAVAVLAAHARRQPRSCASARWPWTTTPSSSTPGSSSLKFCVYRRPDGDGVAARGARPDRRHRDLAAVHGQGRRAARRWPTRRSTPRVRDGRAALDVLAAWLRGRYGGARVLGVGHRVVHGGAEATPRPWSSRPRCSTDLRALVPLAPLHQPYNLAAIEAVRRARCPACRRWRASTRASTAASRPWRSWCRCRADIRDAGVQRYGFHGLSYEYIASVLPAGRARDRRRAA